MQVSHRKGLSFFIYCCCLLCAVCWTVVCRCHTERGYPTLSPVAVCGVQVAGRSSAGVAQKGAVPLYLLLLFVVCSSLDSRLQVPHRKGLPHFICCCCLLCAGRWTVICRCRTGMGYPTLLTVAVCCVQVAGRSSAGVAQKGAAPRHLLSLVAVVRFTKSPGAPRH